MILQLTCRSRSHHTLCHHHWSFQVFEAEPWCEWFHCISLNKWKRWRDADLWSLDLGFSWKCPHIRSRSFSSELIHLLPIKTPFWVWVPAHTHYSRIPSHKTHQCQISRTNALSSSGCWSQRISLEEGLWESWLSSLRGLLTVRLT